MFANFKSPVGKYKIDSKPKWELDDGWKEVLMAAAVEHRVPFSHVQRMVYAIYLWIREMEGNIEMPRIRMPYLFVLKPSQKKLYRYIINLEHKIEAMEKAGQGEPAWMDKRPGVIKDLLKYHGTYFRLEDEAADRKRIYWERRANPNKELTEEAKDKLKNMPRAGRFLKVSLAESRIIKDGNK